MSPVSVVADRVVSQRRPVALAVIAVSVAAALPLCALSDRPAAVLALVGITGATVLAFLLAWTPRGFDLFAPVCLTAFAMWLAYAVNGFFIIFLPDEIETLWGVDVMNRDLAFELGVILLGVVAYVAGYRLGIARSVISPLRDRTLFRGVGWWPAKIAALYGVGWLVRLYFISQGKYTTFVSVGQATDADPLLYKLWYFGFFAYTLAWIYWARRDSPRSLARPLVATISVIEVGYFLAQGSKTYLTMLILIPILVAHYHDIRVGFGKLTIASAVVIAVVFPYVNVFRENFARSLDGPDLGTQMVVEHVAESLTGFRERFADSDRPIWQDFLNRWGGVAPTVAALDRVPSLVDHTWGRDLLMLPFALVPRPLFPLKPSAEGPAVFGERVIGVYDVGISPFPVADWYVNFGLLGVALGMAVWGVLQRAYYRALTDNRDSLKVFLYVATLFELTNVNSYVISGWVGLIQWWAILIPVCYFMGGRLRVPDMRVARPA